MNSVINERRPEPNRFSERHEPQNRAAFDWESTGRTDADGREIKFVRGNGQDRLGPGLLIFASVLLVVLAVGMGIVSFHAQYTYIFAEKGDHTAAWIEALGLDIGAVIFAVLGLALARLGRPAIVPRALNLACVAGSVTMNVFSAHLDEWSSIVVWAMPALLYALTSDQLISVMRRQMIGKDEGSPLKAARGLLLWTLRLIFGPVTTLKGFRAWVLTLPASPGGAHDHPEPAGVCGDHDSRVTNGVLTGPAHESKIVLPALPTEQPGEQRAEQVPSLPIVTAERVPTEQSREQGAEQVVKALPTARRALPAKQSREQVTAQVSELTPEIRSSTAQRREQVRALLSVEELTDAQVAARLGIGRSTAQRDRKALGL